jgi:hypothetical protein
MPSLADHQSNPEWAAYRRGYAHGVEAAISGLVHLLSADDRAKVETWYANVLSPWSQDQKQNQSLAPDFPRIG